MHPSSSQNSACRVLHIVENPKGKIHVCFHMQKCFFVYIISVTEIDWVFAVGTGIIEAVFFTYRINLIADI